MNLKDPSIDSVQWIMISSKETDKPCGAGPFFCNAWDVFCNAWDDLPRSGREGALALREQRESGELNL